MKNFLFAALTFAIATNANKLELGAENTKETCQNFVSTSDYYVKHPGWFEEDCKGVRYQTGSIRKTDHWCKIATISNAQVGVDHKICVPHDW